MSESIQSMAGTADQVSETAATGHEAVVKAMDETSKLKDELAELADEVEGVRQGISVHRPDCRYDPGHRRPDQPLGFECCH